MEERKDDDVRMEDGYDEEADSDFQSEPGSQGKGSSSSDDDQEGENQGSKTSTEPKTKARNKKNASETLELDSGDEATIQERKKAKAKTKAKKSRKGKVDDDSDDDEGDGWRARTRAMREREGTEKAKSRLASVKGSTIDVDEMWRNMNRPGGLDKLLVPTASSNEAGTDTLVDKEAGALAANGEEKNHDTAPADEEMITIDETYEFAGKTQTRHKTVPKSSAEAKLWLSQHGPQNRPQNTDPRFPGDEPIRRPLRKISRFDPNIDNLGSFQTTWGTKATSKATKAHKLNVVEKSKMDWAAHVDKEGLQDELAEQAKAKGAYIGKAQFLRDVEQRRDEEARKVRLRG